MSDTAEGTNTWKNRIVGHGEVDPNELTGNPKNARIHPHRQELALNDALDGVGWVQTVVVNKSSGFILDGHLRVLAAVSAGEATLPVTYVDITEAEENLILASFDAIGAAAIVDEGAMARLAAEIDDMPVNIAALLDDILSTDGIGGDSDEDAANKAAQDDLPDEQTMTWGYATVGKTKVGCSVSEVDLLRDLLDRFKGANNGGEVGFVRWLAVAERPDPGEDEAE